MNGQAAAIIVIAWLAFCYFFIGKSKDGGLMLWGALTGLMILGMLWSLLKWMVS